jgi:hypothetical protein
MKNFLILSVIVFGVSINQANALGRARDVQAARVEFGTTTHAGSGCPAGAVSASLSPDNAILSLIFQDGKFTADSASASIVDVKKCDLDIPIKVPKGYQLILMQTDILGNAFVAPGGRGRLDAEFSIKTNSGRLLGKRAIARKYTEDTAIEESLATPGYPIASACGGEHKMKLKLKVTAQGAGTGVDAVPTTLTLDSADLASDDTVTFNVRLAPCLIFFN